MLGRLTLAAGLIAATTALTAYGALAFSPAQLPAAAQADDLLVQVKSKKGGGKVHHHHHRRHHHRGGRVYTGGGGYCATQRAICATEYGLGTRSYYRCLARRGC
jgi:hypothetical protein